MPETADALAQARRHALRGDFAAAYRLYEAVLPAGGVAVYLEFGKAKYAEHSGASLEEATALFLQASQLDVSSTDARLWLADLYAMGYGEGYRAAADLYRAIARADATVTDAYIGLGLLQGAPGDPVSREEAIAAFRRATEVAPDRLDARINLANALIRASRVPEAQEVLAEAERLVSRAGDQGRLAASRAAAERVAGGHHWHHLAYANDSPRYAWLVPDE